MWSIFTSHNFFYKKIKKIKIGVDKIKILCYYIRVVITTNDYNSTLIVPPRQFWCAFILWGRGFLFRSYFYPI